MATPRPAPDDDYLALIAIDDMGPLLVDQFGLRPAPLSPIQAFVTDYLKGSGTLSKEGAQLEAVDLTRRALTVLAHPELLFITISGGGPEAVVQEVACHAPGIEAGVFVSIAPAPDGTLVIQWHRSPWEFLARWLNSVASGAEEPTPNLIPPPITSEALIYILHAVDVYNRQMMQSRLDHEDLEGRPFITAEDFVKTLAASLSSHDTRWLLPAFLAMTPGVSAKGLGDHEEALEKLRILDFLRAGEDEEGNALLVFGDAAIAMGEEFGRLWSGGAAFRIALARNGELKPLSDGFLAATALANHLILFKEEKDQGQALLNHQTLTRDELENVLAPMMDLALRKIGGKCPECGKPAPPDARFCGYCGLKL